LIIFTFYKGSPTNKITSRVSTDYQISYPLHIIYLFLMKHPIHPNLSLLFSWHPHINYPDLPLLAAIKNMIVAYLANGSYYLFCFPDIKRKRFSWIYDCQVFSICYCYIVVVKSFQSSQIWFQSKGIFCSCLFDKVYSINIFCASCDDLVAFLVDIYIIYKVFLALEFSSLVKKQCFVCLIDLLRPDFPSFDCPISAMGDNRMTLTVRFILKYGYNARLTMHLGRYLLVL